MASDEVTDERCTRCGAPRTAHATVSYAVGGSDLLVCPTALFTMAPQPCPTCTNTGFIGRCPHGWRKGRKHV